eukprot:scaffold109010_cov34-Tisochrysis_lutea.AAC.5
MGEEPPMLLACLMADGLPATDCPANPLSHLQACLPACLARRVLGALLVEGHVTQMTSLEIALFFFIKVNFLSAGALGQRRR